jgi:hypothetical protein
MSDLPVTIASLRVSVRGRRRLRCRFNARYTGDADALPAPADPDDLGRGRAIDIGVHVDGEQLHVETVHFIHQHTETTGIVDLGPLGQRFGDSVTLRMGDAERAVSLTDGHVSTAAAPEPAPGDAPSFDALVPVLEHAIDVGAQDTAYALGLVDGALRMFRSDDPDAALERQYRDADRMGDRRGAGYLDGAEHVHRLRTR